MAESRHRSAEDAAVIVIDDGGVILHIESAGSAGRYVEGVPEGESILGHIHPDDAAFFEVTRNWIGDGGGCAATIRLRWARAHGHWSVVYATLEAESSETLRVELKADDAASARRSEAQMRRVVEGSAQGTSCGLRKMFST